MSITMIAAFAGFLAQVLEWFGIIIPVEQLSMTINTLVTLVSFIVAYFGRWRVGDVNVVGARKT